MLSNQFFPIISLNEKAFKNKETVQSEQYRSGKFLALDIKEKENEYHVVFVDDNKCLNVMSTEKVKFEGFVSAHDAINYLPGAMGVVATTALVTEVEGEEETPKKTWSRKKKEA